MSRPIKLPDDPAPLAGHGFYETITGKHLTRGGNDTIEVEWRPDWRWTDDEDDEGGMAVEEALELLDEAFDAAEEAHPPLGPGAVYEIDGWTMVVASVEGEVAVLRPDVQAEFGGLSIAEVKIPVDELGAPLEWIED